VGLLEERRRKERLKKRIDEIQNSIVKFSIYLERGKLLIKLGEGHA
jgi:hypothetical protein